MGDKPGLRRVYVVRHGQSEKNTMPKWRPMTAKQYDAYLRHETASLLTSKGAKQVNRTAKWLDGVLPHPACIYASKMTRAHETAKIIGKELKLQIIPDKELSELHARRFPRWVPPLPLRVYDILDRLALFIPWPGEESWYSGLLRARKVLGEIASDVSAAHEQSAIIVSHHLFIQMLLLYARFSPLWRVAKQDVTTAGISVLERR